MRGGGGGDAHRAPLFYITSGGDGGRLVFQPFVLGEHSVGARGRCTCVKLVDVRGILLIHCFSV